MEVSPVIHGAGLRPNNVSKGEQAKGCHRDLNNGERHSMHVEKGAGEGCACSKAV